MKNTATLGSAMPVSEAVKGLSSVWFVECRFNETFDGWFAAPPEGIGGWLTQNPNQAKKYTEAEARAVASALSYFRCPFRFSWWIATEHVFVTADSSVLKHSEIREVAAKHPEGRPAGPTMRCEWCGQPQTARQMRKHFTECSNKPRPDRL